MVVVVMDEEEVEVVEGEEEDVLGWDGMEWMRWGWGYL